VTDRRRDGQTDRRAIAYTRYSIYMYAVQQYYYVQQFSQTVVHNSKLLFDYRCANTCNAIAKWFYTIGV